MTYDDAKPELRAEAPPIEGQRVNESQDDDREPVEVLAAEFVDRQRRGETPSIEEYAEEHPELADSIRELFPAIVTIERLKFQKGSSDGRITLGGAEPKVLGDYRLVREVGRGGMGIVYEAIQESLGRRVAVKVLPRQLLLDEKHLRRFQREAQTAAGLHHTNIVPVFGVGQQDGFHYYVMQYIQGIGLDDILTKLDRESSTEFGDATIAIESPQYSHAADTPTADTAGQDFTSGTTDQVSKPAVAPAMDKCEIPTAFSTAYWRWVGHVGEQVAEAMHYAHTQGVLHRDIKPANLLLDEDGVVWVADFGLAKALQHDDVSRTGDLVGTLRYMAPEQFAGESDVRSDLYSLGLTLYELLTLRPAFDEADRSRLLKRITDGHITPPRSYNAAIPRDLETIVLKATARDTNHRYQSAEALFDDLRLFQEDRPIQARRATSVERMWRWCRRNRAVAALAGTALMLLVLVAVVATIGYLGTRAANRDVSNALAGQTRQREIAESTSELAIEALDEIFKQLAPDRIVLTNDATVVDDSETELEIPSQPVLSKETATLLESMLRFYDRLAEQGNEDAALREKVARANQRVGDIQQQLGQFDAAIAAYRRAAEIYGQLDNASDNSFAAEIARIQNGLGSIYQVTGELNQAADSHQLALSLLQRDTSPSLPARYELARTYYLLGVGQRRGPPPPRTPRGGKHFDRGKRPPNPREISRGVPDHKQRDADRSSYLREAISLLEEMIVENPGTPDYRYLLACCYRETSPGWRPHSRWPRGDQTEGKAEQMLESLVQDYPDVADYRFALSETYSRTHMHGPFIKAAEFEKDLQRLRNALAHSVELVASHPNVPNYVSSQVHIRHRLGEMLARGARGLDRLELRDEAITHLRSAVNLQEGLVEQFPEISSYAIWQSIAQLSLGKVLRDSDKYDEARAMLESATETLSTLSESNPDLIHARAPLYDGYASLGQVYRQLGEDELAKKTTEKAESYGFGQHGHRGHRRRKFGGGRGPGENPP